MIRKIKKPYLIAEIGGNHEGNLTYAKKLIDLAVKSQVDCIKLQIYSQKSLVNKNLDPDRYNLWKKFFNNQLVIKKTSINIPTFICDTLNFFIKN